TLCRPTRVLLPPAVDDEAPGPVDREAHRQPPDPAVSGRAGTLEEPDRKAQRLGDLLDFGELVGRVEREGEHPKPRLAMPGRVPGKKRKLLAARRAPGGPEGQDDDVSLQLGSGDALSVESHESRPRRSRADLEVVGARFAREPAGEATHAPRTRTLKRRAPRAAAWLGKARLTAHGYITSAATTRTPAVRRRSCPHGGGPAWKQLVTVEVAVHGQLREAEDVQVRHDSQRDARTQV